MVNTNTYQIKIIPSCVITITKEDDSYSSYVLITNQLVSILYINPKNGEPEVIKGRVKEFIYAQTVRNPFQEMNDRGYKNPISRIALDVSKDYNSKTIEVDPTTILEVHPIDWNYQDTEKAEIDASAEDWYEKDNKVSAPSAEYQFRMEGR